MQKIYSSRLYFKKYPYKINFIRSGNASSSDWTKDWTPHNCQKWLNEQSIDFRVYTKISLQRKKKRVTVRMSLFVPTRNDYDKCIKKYSSFIESITEPFDESHVEILKANTQIVIREKLIYEKYKYVVNFRRTYNQPIDDIDDWVGENFYKTEEDYLQLDVKWVGYGYNPRLYLKNKEDLVLVQLTWGERIKQITIVQTLSELAS